MYRCLLILSLLACSNTYAEINKWVDSDGRVHYSDQLPPSNAKFLSSTGKPAANPESDSQDTPEAQNSEPISPQNAVKTLAEREAELKKTRLAKQAAEKQLAQQQANNEAKKLNCANSQQYLRSLKDGIRIQEIDASGERTFIDDTVRQQRILKSEQDISIYCN